MKKVGILTFHAAHNFGASLQAYALNKIISDLGYESHVMNYGSNNMYPIFDLKTKRLSVIARNLQNILFYNKLKIRNKKYKLFREENLSLFPNYYIDKETLAKLTKDFHALIAGSDQIWNNNPKMKDKSDVYFLNIEGAFKKISYAASFGDDINNISSSSDKIIPWIKDFDSVAVREIEGKEFLDNYNIPSIVTLDPTLLLKKEEWEKIEKKVNINKPYILYYSVDSKKYSIEVTKKIAKELKMPVINLVLHPKSSLSGFKYMIDIAPNEFLNIIHNASFVCTNSFHGTVFSIIYEKPFVSIFNENKDGILVDNRKMTILKNLGLEDHIVTVSSDIELDKLLNYDFTYSKEVLEKLKKHSLDYIINSLKDK